MAEFAYTIGQLAELASVTPRTIRYYTAEGLLPRPDVRGQYALYGEPHLLRLQLIAHLKETYLPLGEIKMQIENLNIEQMRVLLDAHRAAPALPISAADYLAQVRVRQQAPQPTHQLAERAEAYAAAEQQARNLPRPAAPAYGFVAAIAAPAAPERIEEAAAPSQQAGFVRRLMPQRRAHADADTPKRESPQSEQHWRRIELAPGVELHIRDPAAPALHERIERLSALARSLFQEGE